MKRDRRLHGLTSDHHQGLVLARRAAEGRATVEDVRRGFDEALAPHFAAEEELLLPALERAGEVEVVQRTLREHAELRQLLADAEAGRDGALAAFGRALEAHIRFEERELFPAAETHLPAEVLEAIGARAPHPRS